MANRKKRPYRKNERSCDAPDKRKFARVEEDKRSAENDISWYSRNPNLLVAAGSFPFPYRPGMQMKFPAFSGTDYGVMAPTFTIPGVLAMQWAPSIGVANLPTDPANVTAKELYARIRSKYSSELAVDAPDIMIYLLALDSVFAYIAWMKRLYRTLNAWTPNNYVLPDTVLSAMGLYDIDIVQLRSEKTKLWQLINQLVLQSRKFTCPAIMDVFNRHYWMSDNVYTDANTINSQMYLFNPRFLYRFSMLPLADESGNEGPGLAVKLLPVYETRTANKPITANILYEFGRKLIQELDVWDDAYTINGYLMRAYEGNPSFVVSELLQDEVLVPAYEEEVLTQIENSRTVPVYASNYAEGVVKVDNESRWPDFKIVQNPITNSLISNPSFWSTDVNSNAYSTNACELAPTISIRSDAPNVADSVIATRLQCTTRVVGVSGNKIVYNVSVNCGTEIPLTWTLYKKPLTLSADSEGPENVVLIYVQAKGITGGTPPLDIISDIAQFDWHPFLWYIQYNGDASTTVTVPYEMHPIGDTHNLTYISQTDLENLHRVCLFSEFNAFSV